MKLKHSKSGQTIEVADADAPLYRPQGWEAVASRKPKPKGDESEKDS